jgi:polysaccharide export outer membrane protein
MIKERSGEESRGVFLLVVSLAGLLRGVVLAIALGGLTGCAPIGADTNSPRGGLASTVETGTPAPPPGSTVAISKGTQTNASAGALGSTPGSGTPTSPSGSSAPGSPGAEPISPAGALASTPGAGTLSRPPGSALTAAKGGDYRIVPDDILQVVVYQAPDFNRDAQVDATGNIALPLLGAIPVAGRTTRDVEGEITGRLKAKYLQNPQVSVTVKDAVGLRVTVEGGVVKPGVVQLRGSVTLLSLIAQSGGFTDTADKSTVLIVRNTESGRALSRFDTNAIAAGTAEDPPVYGGDTVVVDDSTAKTAWKNLGSALGVVGLATIFLH